MGSSPIPQQGTTVPTPGQPGPLAPGEWQPSASPTVVSFKHHMIEPPTAVYVQTGDTLIIDATTNITISDTLVVAARLLLPYPPQPQQPTDSVAAAVVPGALTAAQIAAAAVAPAGGSPPLMPALPAYIQQFQVQVPCVYLVGATVRIPLIEGYLLSVAASATNGGTRGLTFARCWLQQRSVTATGLPAAKVLFADYPTPYAPIGWPDGRVLYPTEGPGNIVEVVIGNPSAGMDWVYLFNAQTRARISSVGAKLATSATASNRIPRIQILSTASTIVWSAAVQQAQAASLTGQFSAGPAQVQSVVDTTTLVASLPSPCILAPGETLRVSTLNIQAGDQWSNIVIVAEEWLDAC